MPPPGSTAKACTDDSTPERTRKVPRSDSENVEMTRKMFQACSIFRRSCTAIEWTSAVPSSHGMNEAFSTGSQAQ